MPRYIDADKIEYKKVAYPIYDFSTGMMCTKYLEGEYAEREDVEYLPTADVQEVRHGRWDLKEKDVFFYCSCCGYKAGALFKYCPNCGAMMDIPRRVFRVPGGHRA